ncbi:Metallo-dependent hydrolase [Meredithblackwellia eburnea MCA 4105]
MTISTQRIFHGAIIHSLTLTELEVLPSALLGVDDKGIIAFLDKDVPADKVQQVITDSHKGWENVQLVTLKRGEFLCPGFIDTHTHAPQYPNLSFGQQFELLDWLTHVTFPTEAKFSDAQYARRTYEGVVQRVINTGTTTCSYYGTLHLTTKILAAVCHRKGQRAFVGKCNMDRHALPEYQEASASTSLADTKEFVNFVKRNCVSPSCSSPKANGHVNGSSHPPTSSTNLVQPILTPRFAISCTNEVLTGLSEMMKEDPDLHLQTHLAENPSEVQFARSLFPSACSYTDIYNQFGLLRNNSILAHCVHLAPDEMELIRSTKAGISHCPTSNFNLRSGASKVADMLDRGIKVSLGTDVSGGFGLGILTTLRQASIASKTIVFLKRDAVPAEKEPSPAPPSDSKYPVGYFASRHLSLETLFYLATMGGAEVCCLEDRVGNFLVGKEFDALLVQSGQKDLGEVQGEAAKEPALGDADEDIMKFVETESTFPEEVKGWNPAMFVEPDDSLEKVFEKFLFAGDDRNLGSVFVRGRVVGGARPIEALTN